MQIPDQLRRAHPEIYWLDLNDPSGLQSWLKRHNWLASDDSIVRLEKPGEGNMNCTLRVVTTERTLIVKQARPWVEKYPTIEAPWDRAIVEGKFYELIAVDVETSAFMPKLLGRDSVSRINLFEDLGDGEDLTWLYRQPNAAIEPELIAHLAQYLSLLHERFRNHPDQAVKADFANRAMRELNYHHIFVFPLLGDNNFDLDQITPGLQSASQFLKDDSVYMDEVSRLGELYLSDGDVLLHGDYFPGSWLRTASGVKIIDPEFCFYGPAEFDLGVMTAHLLLSGQPQSSIDQLLQSYRSSVGIDQTLIKQFAGVEIMRRLIGVAQLPAWYGLERKAQLLKLSSDLIKEENKQG